MSRERQDTEGLAAALETARAEALLGAAKAGATQYGVVIPPETARAIAVRLRNLEEAAIWGTARRALAALLAPHGPDAEPVGWTVAYRDEDGSTQLWPVLYATQDEADASDAHSTYGLTETVPLYRTPQPAAPTPVSLRALDVERLADALCVSSHHGLSRTSWPCDYHRKRAADAIAVLGECVRALEALEREPPIFRDYTGTDWPTCACCREPVDAFEVERGRHSHLDDCPVVLAAAALARAKEVGL